MKYFYQSFFGNKVDFRDAMNVSLNILAKNLNFKKLIYGFVDEGAMIKTTLMPSCHWKTLVPFCLRRKGSDSFNINSELSQNRTEKQIMSFKTTINWLFNDS